MEHKDSMKPPYISTLDGILTAGGELIGYQELEMDSPYLDVHEDTSYTKDYVTLHSHEFYELLFCFCGAYWEEPVSAKKFCLQVSKKSLLIQSTVL